MKKAIVTLIILTSLSSFILSHSNKPISGIEINVKNSKGEIVHNGITDKKGSFNIKIKDKGNYSLSISSDEIRKGLTNINNGRKGEVHYLVTLTVKASSDSWTTDTENRVTHSKIVEKDTYIEVTQGVIMGNENGLSEWSESMINIISKGDGMIKGTITCVRI